MASDAHTLFELNEYIRRILALNLSEPIWVKCEIAQFDIAKVHCFLDLVEKDEEGTQIIARAGAVIWDRTYRSLKRKLGKELQSLLQEGMEVMFYCQVDYHERFGLKLIIQDVDLSYTLGKYEQQKRWTLDQLQKEKLLSLNKEKKLPLVLQNIAVLSSQNAAGLQDFLHQISNNPFQFHINTQIFDATLQGESAVPSMMKALKKINLQSKKWDCLVIIRGGGAKLDLAPFNDYDLCKSIAEMSLPVLTGIGHETDETIADFVAHTVLKTPTAAADFILSKNMAYENSLLEIEQQIKWIVRAKISQGMLELKEQEERLLLLVQQLFIRQEERLKAIEEQFPLLVFQNLKSFHQELKQLEELSILLNVENSLKRGYSITEYNGQILTSVDQIEDGSEITTHLKQGILKSTIHKKES